MDATHPSGGVPGKPTESLAITRDAHGPLYRLGSLGDGVGDTAPERLKHRLLVYMALLMGAGAVMWSALSLAFGLALGAAIPPLYIVWTVANLSLFARSKKFERASLLQISASVLLPFLFQFSIGGFYASGAALLWALVALVGSLTFTGRRVVVMWLVLYTLLVVASGMLDGLARAQFAKAISEGTKVAFFVANFTFISIVVVLLMLYFFDQRETALRELSAANSAIHHLEKEVLDARKLGQYTLVSKLGAGGMGAVYRARHAMLRRPTAIKLVQGEMIDEAILARFEREVQLTATLTHPNVVTIFDYGRTEDGTFYYAMEYLEGADLGVVVRRSGPLPARRAVHILRQIADALDHAHSKGLIHRDIKPANILLTNSHAPDVVKVVDFGLVKEMKPEGNDNSLTQRGTVSGTPSYMSPEAISRPDEIDGRTDVYSLGCVAYYLLTGLDVFEAKTAIEMYAHHLHSAPLAPSARMGADVPKALEDILLSCLAKSPEDRPAIGAVLARLRVSSAEAWAHWDHDEASEWWSAIGGGLVNRSEELTDSMKNGIVPRPEMSASREKVTHSNTTVRLPSAGSDAA